MWRVWNLWLFIGVVRTTFPRFTIYGLCHTYKRASQSTHSRISVSWHCSSWYKIKLNKKKRKRMQLLNSPIRHVYMYRMGELGGSQPKCVTIRKCEMHYMSFMVLYGYGGLLPDLLHMCLGLGVCKLSPPPPHLPPSPSHSRTHIHPCVWLFKWLKKPNLCGPHVPVLEPLVGVGSYM